jgi:RNA polymerase sigma-70 factor (ECF subfamily)
MRTPAMNSQPPAPHSLGALMFRISMRDQAAFGQLYDATAHYLLGIIVRMVHDRSWGEEILQEAYVSIWHAAPNYSAVKGQPMTG